MGRGFESFFALFLLLCSAAGQRQQQEQEFARDELFPEQLLQQQLQFQQRKIMDEIQTIQRQQQFATDGQRQLLLRRNLEQMLLRLQQIQQQQQQLQDQLQQQFAQQEFPPSRRVNFSQFNQDFNNQLQQPQSFVPEQSTTRHQIFGQPTTQQTIRQQTFGQPTTQQPIRQQTFGQQPTQQPIRQQTFGQTPAPNIQQQVFGQKVQQPPTPPSPPVQQPVTQGRIIFQGPSDGKTDIGPPCATQQGEAGRCRPLVKCITFYAEIPELRKHPCKLTNSEFGVCCPLRKRPAEVPPGLDRPNNGVLRPPPKPQVEIPPLTPQQLNEAANVAITKILERLELQNILFENQVVVIEGTPTGLHNEFFATTNETLEQGDNAQKSVEASVSLVNQFNLSPDQGAFALPEFSILNTVIADTCPQEVNCKAIKYRSVDGSCNNLRNRRWGQSSSSLQRILPPKYGDGVNSPRTTTANGIQLPSARVVSKSFARDADITYDNYTLLIMQWGQFLDHDMTHTPISKGKRMTGISCCRGGDVLEPALLHPDCFPIIIPGNDTYYGKFNQRCMDFVRSLPAPRPECNFGPREQMNQITAYLDGSMIYGSIDRTAQKLREFRGGRLRAQNVRGRPMLPEHRDECTDDDDHLACFLAGDGRVNEQVQLTVMHTLWMREHNRVAAELQRLNPGWSDEALYQEARRIVVAELQHITYNEYLPLILGRSYMEKFELTPKEKGHTDIYDETLNPSITNVFATAAFRYGHSLIQGSMQGFSRFGNVKHNLLLHKNQFSPFVLYEEGSFDNLIRGISTQECQKFDHFFSKELTDHLFQGDLQFGLDLVALNIQRGRDHGLPPYNDWREVCGLPRANRWEDLLDVMDPQVISILRNMYGSVDEIDLFVGGVSEKALPGALLGQTFVCLVGDQFARARRGDRFFYEEGGKISSFSEDQLQQLRKANLARILCDNSDSVALMQPLAFFRVSFLNQRVSCNSDSIPRVDLTPWRNEPVPV